MIGQSANSKCPLLPASKQLVLKNIVIVAEINELKSSFCAVLFHCFSIVMHNNCKDKYLEISRMLSHADMQNMEPSLEPFHIIKI